MTLACFLDSDIFLLLFISFVLDILCPLSHFCLLQVNFETLFEFKCLTFVILALVLLSPGWHTYPSQLYFYFCFIYLFDGQFLYSHCNFGESLMGLIKFYLISVSPVSLCVPLSQPAGEGILPTPWSVLRFMQFSLVCGGMLILC